MALYFETEAKTVRPRPKCLEAELEANGNETKAETEAKMLASKAV